MMIDRRSALPLMMVAMGLLASCDSRSAEETFQFDLISGFPMAESWTETRHVELGTLSSQQHLESGWSDIRWDKNRKVNYVLADDDEALLRLTILEPRTLIIRAYGRPRDPERQAGDVVEARVNGNRVAEWVVQPNNKRYRVRVPEGLMLNGDNELSLRYRPGDGNEIDSVSENGSGRSMIWFSVEIEDPKGQEPPRVQLIGEGDSILIPWGTRVEYYLRLPPEARLELGQVKFVGSSAGSLEIDLEEDGSESERVGIVDSPVENVEFPFAGEKERIVRLTLRAAARQAVMSARSGAVISGAVIGAPDPRRAARDEGRNPSVDDSRGSGIVEDRNVFLYVIDTLRSDHLGMYGYQRQVSPNLDRFAADATIFDNAVAQSSWTRSAMASVFTGIWPIRHDTNGRKDKLAPEALTLAEVLNKAGMETIAVVRNWNIFPTFGFAQGFEEFRALQRGQSTQINESVQYWLQYRDPLKPFFLYVHTVDPHGPYRPPEKFKQMFAPPGLEPLKLDKHPGSKRTKAMSEEQKQQVAEHLINLYDGEIAFNDSTFAELLEMFESRNLIENTLIVILSDHGEEFLEHGTWEHGKNLFAETLNVPLIIRFPEGGHGVRVQQVVQHIDIMPTILDWLGIPVPDIVEGRSLIDLINDEGTGVAESRLAFSYLELDGLPTQSVVDGEWKFIERLRGDTEIWSGLFSRETDRGDEVNVIHRNPIRARYMSILLDAKVREGSLLTTSEAVLDTATENALRALGYLQ